MIISFIYLIFFLCAVDNSSVRLMTQSGLLDLEGRRSPRTSPPRTLLQGILNHQPGASPLISSLQGAANGILGGHRVPPFTSTATGHIFDAILTFFV